MSGPEMLQKALALAKMAEGQELDHAMFTLAQAQVYMTGALAAATALPGDLNEAWLAATRPTKAGAA